MSRTTLYSEDFLRRLVLRELSHAVGHEVSLDEDDLIWDRVNIELFLEDDEEFWFFIMRLSNKLGVEIDWSEIPKPLRQYRSREEFVDAMRTVTFGDLLQYLSKRSQTVSFAPLQLPGVPGCEEAGVFLGVTELVQRIDPRQTRIAPGMPVKTALRGTRLMQLWQRLAILSEDAVPIPPAPRLLWGMYCYLVAVLMVLVGIIGEWQQPGWGWLLSVGCLWGFKFFHVGLWLRESAVPLPPGVHTWGDLARYLTPRWPGTHEIGRCLPGS